MQKALTAIGLVVASEAAATILFALWLQRPLPEFGLYLTVAAVGCAVFLTLALLLELAKLYSTHTPSPSLELWRAAVRSRERLIVFMLGSVAMAIQLAASNSFKTNFTLVAPFWMDRVLAELDKTIFGQDAWRITHAVIGEAGTRALDWLYLAWFPIKVATIALLLALAREPFRSRALLSYFLLWPILGCCLAAVLSSAGPCYYDAVTGSHRFAALGAAVGSDASLNAPKLMALLWGDYRAQHLSLGSGISAMPSMHVAIATWNGLVIFQALKRGWQWIGPLYTAAIFVASVHLGWHYAVDGIASMLATMAIWLACGWWIARTPRPAPVMATAS